MVARDTGRSAQRRYRRTLMLEKILADVIKTGRLTVRYPDGQVGRYGEGSPEAEWVIRHQPAIRRLIRNPWLQMGETYMSGAWDAPKGLAMLLEVLLRNVPDEPPPPRFSRTSNAISNKATAARPAGATSPTITISTSRCSGCSWTATCITRAPTFRARI